MTGLAYPAVSPIIFSIGSFSLRWYSMAYLIGILFGWWLMGRRIKKYDIPLTAKQLEDAVFYITLGIILGGRLGYVLFYGQGVYWREPWRVFEIWQGGMSFHGGIIGVIVALWLFSRRAKLPMLKLTDLLAPVVPLGIFLGRLANFVNDELWGRVTDVAWAVRFPRGGYVPRHPSQIYEACLEGILLFTVLNVLWQVKWCRERTGFLSAIFLLGYAACRAFVEQFREPDKQIGFLWGGLTMGQCLSIPVVALGIWLLYRAVRRRPAANSAQS